MTKRPSTLGWAAALLLLAGCEREAPGDPAPATPTPTPAAPEPTPASIIRPDVMPAPEVEPPPPPLQVVVPFAQGGTTLSEEAARALAPVLASEQFAQGWPVVLRGHTDSVGHDEANLRASRRRAEAVAAWLTEHGVDEARIEIIAMGEQRPVAPNALPDGSPDEAGRARNRRVEITLAPREPEKDPAEEPESAPDG